MLHCTIQDHTDICLKCFEPDKRVFLADSDTVSGVAWLLAERAQSGITHKKPVQLFFHFDSPTTFCLTIHFANYIIQEIPVKAYVNNQTF